MKRIFVLFQLLLVVVLVMAVPAKRGQFKIITLADGSQVKAELVGDEFMNYWRADDGRCFVKNGDVYVLANLDRMAKRAAQKRSLRALSRKAATRGVGDAQKAYIGKKKGIIILVQFTDKSFQSDHNQSFYNRVANESGFSEGDFKGSVHDYFYDQSNGQFDLTFDVAGPYTLQNNYAYYGQNVKNDDGEVTDYSKNADKMIIEAIDHAAKEFDFSQYDWDGDGEVDQVFVLYAGQGEANGGDEDTVWPHEWSLYSATGSTKQVNNTTVNTYACAAELGGSESITSGIGTICHEFTHCLGVPDFYDTSNNETQQYGMGNWDVMCGGSYNGDGFIPAGYTSYEKMWCGWLTPTELTEDTNVSALKPLTEGGGAYVIYNDNHKDEYFLLECRNQTGWDAATAGKGLLIIHVDYDPNVWWWNVPNAFSDYKGDDGNYVANDHMRCTFMPADNARGAKNEAGDPYPFNINNSFSNISNPAATLYNANTDGSFNLNKSVKNITRNADGTVSFDFYAVDTNTTKVLEGTLFNETFDQCAGEGGNDGIWTKASSELLADYSGWDYKKNTGFGGNKCARFGTAVTKGSATSPGFEVGDEAELTFKAAPMGEETGNISVYVQNSATTTVTPSMFAMTTGQWTECKATIKGAGFIKLAFSGSKNRFFLDDVKVEAVSGSTGIKTVVDKRPADGTIYNLQGRNMGTDASSLPKGIYIINGKKVIK